MVDDQVKYSELLVKDEDVFANLIKELGDVKTKISELKTEASGLSGVLKNISTATREQQQATAANAKSVELLAQKTKDLAATKKNLEDATRRFGNLTDEEVGRLDRLATKLKFSSQWQEATAKLVDTTNMSYNEMKATLAVLTNALHTFGTEEKKNSGEAKALENAIERVRDAMKELDDRTKAVAAAEKQMAEEAKKAAKEEEEAYKASQKEAAKRVKTQEELHNARQKEIEDAFKARDAEMAKMKLTEEEYNSVKQLKSALAGTSQEQIAAMQNLEIQNKSYNELYQTYNAIKDVLNAMTVAERENTEAGKAMVNRSKEIRDTLNNLQQQTGNYTLNVGNYMSAMNGLQMQTQQILREIPSAQNLSQFFLAISNNIPMFTDALARYNKGLPEIKAKLAAVTAEITRQEAALAGMNAQSTEYAAKQAQINELRRQEQQLQSASVGGWRAILKSVGSWQTLLIAGLLILRKIPDWVKAIRERWRETHETIKNVVSAQTALGQLHADVAKKVDDEAAELRLVVDRLQQVSKGTDEWVNGIATVNKITGENLDATTATIEMVDEVTKAYIRQAEQLATNAILTDRIAQSNANQLQRQAAMAATTFEGLDQIMGGTTGNDRMKLQAAFNKRQKALRDLQRKQAGETVTRQVYETTRTGAIYTNDVEIDESAIKRELDDATRTLENIINKKFEVLSKEAIDALEAEYDLSSPMLKKKTPKTPKTPRTKTEKDPVKDLLTLQRQLEDAQTANIEDEYARLEQAEIQRHRRFIEDRQAELKLLSADDPRREIINKQIEEEAETHSNKMFEIAEKRRQELIKQSEEEEKAREKAAKDGAKAELKAAVDGWAEYKAKMVEEGKTRKQIVEAEVAAEIARLKLMQDLNRDVNGEIMSDEQKAKVQEWINLLEKLQQTGNYGDYKPGQFMGKGGANVTSERKNYANIWEVLGIDMDNNQVSAINSVFDQAKEALNSWMDARKAAADQAKELADDEVSAAENALNREIELRNQGYANDVALREKELADAKEKQKKAVEEQKKIAQEQILLDAALQTSSLITASANILKQFAAQPLLAASLLGLMWGSFGYAKIKAYQASTKSIKFKEGGVMLLEGGSHESGHDVNLGIGPDGSNLRAEGGEYFAVINKRSSRKYGSQIPAVVNALNSGMFEDRYIKTSDAVGLLPQVIRADNGAAVDLSSLEGGVDALVKQGEQNWTIEGDYRVLRYKNLTRRVKIG